MLPLNSLFNLAASCISADINTVMSNLTMKKNKNLHIQKKLSLLCFINLSISTLFTQKFLHMEIIHRNFFLNNLISESCLSGSLYLAKLS